MQGRIINLYRFPKSVKKAVTKAAVSSLPTVDFRRHCRENGPMILSDSVLKHRRNPVINLILIEDAEIRKLNRNFRKTDRITDVISFLFSKVPLAGDIYIAKQRSKKQAKVAGHRWENELSYLAIHGILHLLGFTDYTVNARKKMFNKQDKIFRGLFPS